ncbi:hypothetical protein PFISCL1PPCAC_19880 [Pristionchus fissidentatus]|uniref:GPI ethanolamine phosphate transferase 1 n=1 Tax=Pristionchus fissidentatus TaxID=1538716 RepID=A0AAV5WD09_9BILA|nr:hypothetical protein PFISCL1PPCAC_19880 [Pristionchus fissidentatus]
MDEKIRILGVIVHVILLYSIFDIFYTSPIIASLPVHRPNTNDPPAKRLFLISADGLRYDTFMENKQLSPFLHSLVDRGMASYGVSNSHVPTESRPGHVSMMAGFTEDVSAVTTGWKKNPVTFDTLFNRSVESRQWGSEDITHLFSHIDRVKTESFPSEWEDFSSTSNFKLDEWVFDKCEGSLLNLSVSSPSTLSGNGRLFFLHLVGIDTNGHGHRPHSSIYKDNLRVVDHRLERLVRTVHEVFGDNKTAFIFTSDHGMTDWGSHGGGSEVETQTPLVIWGSGVRGGVRESLEQVDICPLIASLLSIPFPINNLGIVRTSLLSVSPRYESNAVMTNFLQLREIILHQISRVGKRWWLSGKAISASAMQSLIDQTNILSLKGRHSAVSSLVSSQLPLVRNSVFVYHRVDRPLLSLLVTLSFLLFLLVFYLHSSHSLPPPGLLPSLKVTVVIASISIMSSFMIVSSSHLLYIILPVYLLSILPIRSLPTLISPLLSFSSLPPLLLIISLNLSFYERRLSSLFTIFLLSLPKSLYNNQSIVSQWTTVWSILSLSLFPFPFLPPSGLLSFPLLSSFPPFILSILLRHIRSIVPSKSIIDSLLSLSILTSTLIVLHSIFPSSSILRFMSWLLLPLPYLLVYRTPPRSISRLLSLSVSMFLPYCLLSSSYESLYILLLLIFLFVFTRISSCHSSSILFFNLPLSSSFSSSSSLQPLPLLLTFLTLFSTGNLASLSSFSPSSLSRFISVFSPFTMASLLLLKLLSPILLIFLHLRASLPSLSSSTSLLSSTLIYSDLLSLLFFFQLRDSGSWLDIGMSIAHYVISLCSSLAFYFLFLLSDFLLSVPLNPPTKHFSNA